MGAWIETSNHGSNDFSSLSHPIWVRGLKLKRRPACENLKQSHPIWVRGLKRYLAYIYCG